MDTQTRTRLVRSMMIAAMCAAGLGGSLVRAQAPGEKTPVPAWSYDTHCQKPVAEKRRIFREASPELKARIARTQAERWRDANLAVLTTEQKRALNDLIAAITPDLFKESEESAKTVQTLEARLGKVFTGSQVDQFDRDGPCIAKQGGDPGPFRRTASGRD